MDNYFLSVFEDIVPFSSGLNYSRSVVSCASYYCFFEDNLHFSLLVACRLFYFSLGFLSIYGSLCVYTDGVCSTAGIWALMSSVVGKVLGHYFFKYYFRLFSVSSTSSNPVVYTWSDFLRTSHCVLFSLYIFYCFVSLCLRLDIFFCLIFQFINPLSCSI